MSAATTTKPRAKVEAERAKSTAGRPSTISCSAKASILPMLKIQRVCTQLNQAVALLDMLAQHDDNQACWGASRLLDMAAEQLAKAINSEDPEVIIDGRAILIEALTIMAMIADSDAALPIAGVITIAELVRDQIDAAAGSAS